MSRGFKFLLAVAAVTFVSLQAQAGDIHYIRSTVGPPWGVSENESAMNDVFGIGGWFDSRYELVTASDVFDAGTSLVFMEGGDNNADELEAFLGANMTLIEDWVSNGGCLLIQSAPNEGDGLAYPFGVTLSYPDFGGAGEAHAVDGSHPIFAGPFLPVATDYTGNFFSHSSVSGGGIGGILMDGDGSFVLAELFTGSGLMLVGGMTTDNFHDPDPHSDNLTRNILFYLANAKAQVVPEPATIVLAGTGALALFGGYRMRRRKEPVA